MFEERTIASSTVFSGRVFSAEVLSVALHDGTRSRREIVRHNGGAAVVAIDSCRRIVLVRQFRKAIEQTLLEIPAGKLEIGEDPRVCGRRELREETGYQAGIFEPLTILYPSPGYCSEILYLYYADNLTAGRANPDQGEHVETVLLSLDECMRYIGDGRIRDAKTIAGILMAARKVEYSGDTD